VTGPILWANLHLLFWLSLVPFVTGWMGENHFETIPAASYGFVLLASGTAYVILQHYIIKSQGPDSPLKRAVGNDWKGKVSPVLYSLGIAGAFLHGFISLACYAAVTLIWIVPDLRIERVLKDGEH
jgi:uncharacterized membrane protein